MSREATLWVRWWNSTCPFKLDVEVDALYRRFGDRGASCFFTGCSSTRRRANSWEFPILVKRRWPFPLASPYAGVGYTPRRVGKATVITRNIVLDPLRGRFIDS
jgi:hypothetical protein